MIRLFVPDDLAAGSPVTLSAAQAHYLRDVMRRATGDDVALFNGRDGEWLSAIASIERKAVGVIPKRRTREQTPGVGPRAGGRPGRKRALGWRPSSRRRPSWASIASASPSPALPRPSGPNVERLTAIAVEARPSRRDAWTCRKVMGPAKLNAILKGWPADRALIFCDEAGDAPPILEAVTAPRERSRSGPGAEVESSARPRIRPGILPGHPLRLPRGEGRQPAGQWQPRS